MNQAQQRKSKNNQEGRNYHTSNKENISSKSLFEPQLHPKGKSGEESNQVSGVVSPTFQTNNTVSLKDDLFKQNKGYAEFRIDISGANKKLTEGEGVKTNKFSKKMEDLHLKQQLSLEEERQRLIQHYKSKKYWEKI